MIKPPDKSIIPLMESILNTPLSYTNFCKALNIPKKSTGNIHSQIKSLEVYCSIEIDTSKYPKTYKITKILNPNTPHFIPSISRDKYQNMCEFLLFYKLSKNNNNPLYLSGTELLNIFGITHHNFKIACNKNMMKFLTKYKNMNEVSLIALNVLKKWIMSKIDKMHDNGFIIKAVGYRGYQKDTIIDKYYKINIPIGSEEEKICERIYNDAYSELRAMNPKNSKWKNNWIPFNMNEQFENLLRSKIKKEEKFKKKFDTIKKVIIISPAIKDRSFGNFFKDKTEDINLYQKELKEEAKRKIRERNEFKKFKQEQIEEFIQINIEDCDIDLKEEYDKIIEFIKNKRKEHVMQLCKIFKLEAADIEELYKKEIEKAVRLAVKEEYKITDDRKDFINE